MCIRKEKRVILEVVGIDVKNFPVVSRLLHAPSILRNTVDIVNGRLQRHRDEFRRIYNENHRREPFPLSLRTDEEVDSVTTALQDLIPITTECMRLNETSKNLEQMSQGARIDQTVYWMGITATSGGSKDPSLLTTSVKEGTKNFSWVGSDLRSHMILPVEIFFRPFFHKHASAEETTTLRFFLSHHWKPRDERTISSGEDIASTLASAELPLKKIRFRERPTMICEDLSLIVHGRKLAGASGDEYPRMSVKISIKLEG